jgi:phosphate starvation-inducible PhoH-like protein
MTKRALKRMMREGEFDVAQFDEGGKIRRLPLDRAWSPLGGHEEPREQGYLKTIKAKSVGQGELLAAIDEKNLVLALGPAGTGKTYIAIAKAVEALEAGKVGRIVLSRPAIEAGESLGFLPGDMEDKLAPYLRPLYDALSDRLSMKRVKALMAEGLIEIAPVGYMRGRTLNNAFVVIDEAQNCTYGQLKMLLTRLGWHSTMVVTGDPNQSDLLAGMSGLADVADRFEALRDVAVVRLQDVDIVATRWWLRCWACSRPEFEPLRRVRGGSAQVFGQDGHLEHEGAVVVLILEHDADELFADVDLAGVLLFRALLQRDLGVSEGALEVRLDALDAVVFHGGISFEAPGGTWARRGEPIGFAPTGKPGRYQRDNVRITKP